MQLEKLNSLLNSGDIVGALKIAREAKDSDPKNLRLQLIWADLLSSVGQHESALEVYSLLTNHMPTSVELIRKRDSLVEALKLPVIEQKYWRDRDWRCEFPKVVLDRLQKSLHNYRYRDVPFLKNPFDIAIYTMFFWEQKPKTIFEIGSKSGGGALWMSDLLRNYEIDGHIYSIDVVPVTTFQRPNITFIEGNGRMLERTLKPEFLNNLPRPWLVIEDADHMYPTTLAVLKFFHPYILPEEYIVVEDGIISDLGADAQCNSGPHRALKEFLAKHENEYLVDARYCDFFGNNVTWNTNGFLRKTSLSNGPNFSNKIALNAISPVRENEMTRISISHPTVNPDGESFVKEVENLKLLISLRNFKEALLLVNQLKRNKIPINGLDFCRAQTFLGLGRKSEAFEAAKEGLRYFPDDKLCAELVAKLDSEVGIKSNIEDLEFREVLKIIRPYTMLSEARLYSLFSLAKKICALDLPGNFVECGVAAGGSSAMLAYVIKKHSRRQRYCFSCDTFEGLPEASENDTAHGENAISLGWGAGTCAAPLESLMAVAEALGVQDLIYPLQGLFSKTLGSNKQSIGSIALLHADGDWYESTKDIFENLYDSVVGGGFVQIDDYGYWQGCKQAVHEFEKNRQVRFQLNSIDGTGVWFQKSPQTPASFALPLIPLKWNFPIKTKAAISSTSENKRSEIVVKPRLNLGCGSQVHPEWTNVDIMPRHPGVINHDLNKQLPFADDSFEVVYHSHVLEHLTKEQGKAFLAECFRVLKHGGILRVVVPDLERIARLYLENLDRAEAGDEWASARHEWMLLELLDQMVRETSGGEMGRYFQLNPMPAEDFVLERFGHQVLEVIKPMRANPALMNRPVPPLPRQIDAMEAARFRQSGEIHKWMYDRRSLERLMANSGFSEISVMRADESLIPDFDKYHLDRMPDGSTRKPDSLFMEAVKP
jgi:cephalosporin hydroxylase/predicted SAM-dependent methyltransferase